MSDRCVVPECGEPASRFGVCMGHRLEETVAQVLVELETDRPLNLDELDAKIERECAQDEVAPVNTKAVDWVPGGVLVQAHGATTTYGAGVMRGVCDRMSREAEEGVGRNNALWLACWAIGRYVGGGEIDRDDAIRTMLEAGHLMQMPHREVDGLVARGIAKGMQQPKSAPSR